jgi:hypothetical protein
MATIPIKQEFTPDLVLRRIQDHVKEAFGLLQSKYPLLNGKTVTVTATLPVGSNSSVSFPARHGLNRVPQGYIVVANPQNLSIAEDTATNNPVPNLQKNFLFARTTNSPATTSQTVTFWFF